MRKVLIFLLACISSVAAAQQPRIDASSPKALERSYAKVIENLDDEAQQRFAVAMTTIGVVMAQRPDLGGSAKIKDMIDGKTADEIIDMARAIELPFVVSPSRAQNAQIERVSSKELKERFGMDSESKKEKKEPQKTLDFSNSLVPPKK